MFKRKISALGLGLAIFLSSLFLSGCSEKPFLTQTGSYVLITISPSGMTQSELIELPWNTNKAIMQKLLLESSFVLSDLHTPKALDSSISVPLKTTILQANFTEPKRMSFNVDKQILTIDVQSLQIEVEGANVGQVTLNQTITLQGINNPNLQPAFQALRDILRDNN
ncbi:MAG: hypothetical protein APF81_15030 [Desulfosporosinus sp. BRH_c37]|nr:MAG: hypothetical protein APF81_15030 [Desulfosporosinus sp. BRH_c37]